MEDQTALFVTMGLQAWNSYITRTDKLLKELSDEDLQRQIAPGKNRGIYLLGHLIAVHDGIIKILGLGERRFTNYDQIFLEKADDLATPMPPATQLRQEWNTLNGILSGYFSAMAPADWFRRHESMTDADFAREPYRNKLSVLMNRTNHLAWHYGQLLLLKK